MSLENLKELARMIKHSILNLTVQNEVLLEENHLRRNQDLNRRTNENTDREELIL